VTALAEKCRRNNSGRTAVHPEKRMPKIPEKNPEEQNPRSNKYSRTVSSVGV
jgi:hypothetical protein